jgi:hypothetical protein
MSFGATSCEADFQRVVELVAHPGFSARQFYGVLAR